MGIGHPGHKSKVTGHVLSKASPDEQIAIDSALTATFESLPLLLEGDIERARTQINGFKLPDWQGIILSFKQADILIYVGINHILWPCLNIRFNSWVSSTSCYLKLGTVLNFACWTGSLPFNLAASAPLTYYFCHAKEAIYAT